jgi:hypothetical protein
MAYHNTSPSKAEIDPQFGLLEVLARRRQKASTG